MGFIVTSFQIFKKSRDTFLAPIEHSGPLLCLCLLWPGLSQTPCTWHASLTILQCLRKQCSPLTQGCRPLCQPLLAMPPGMAPNHFQLNSPSSPHPVSHGPHHHLLGGPRQRLSASPLSSTYHPHLSDFAPEVLFCLPSFLHPCGHGPSTGHHSPPFNGAHTFLSHSPPPTSSEHRRNANQGAYIFTN